MKTKRPYKHIIKNLFHEQATEIVPLLRPGWVVTQAFEVELPMLETKELERKPTETEKGVATLGLNSIGLEGAEVTGIIQTEWIEHSGQFERVYRVQNSETNKPSYLHVEVQTDPDYTKNLASNLLLTNVHMLSVAREDIVEADVPEDEDEEPHIEGTLLNKGFFVHPNALCLFPNNVPEDIIEKFHGQVMMEFHFKKLCIWEKDAREFLNTHATAIYFLLPVMKNADASLLGLAIKEIAEKFHEDETELGRHLTGMNLLIQLSQTLPDEEKQAVQTPLQPFKHLIKDQTDEEEV